MLDLHQTQLIVRGKDVGLVVDTLTATNGLLWVYEGGAVTLTECTLQGVGVQVSSVMRYQEVAEWALGCVVQVGSTFRGDRDQTRNNVTPHVNDTGTEALISGCTLVSEQQNLTPAAVRNGAQLVIENSNISGVGTRCVDVGGKDTVAQLLDCDLRSDVPCIPNPFEQWNSCIGASVSLGATLRLEKCCFQNFGSAAMTASDASSLKVLKCKVEECYRGLWAWSAAEVRR